MSFKVNFNPISYQDANCILFNENILYELYDEECYETKYNNPFDYYCDKEKVTFETIVLNVDEEDIKNANQTTNYFMKNSNSQENNSPNILKPFSITKRIEISKYIIKYFHVLNGSNILFVTEEDYVYGFGTNDFGCCGLGHNSSVSEPKYNKRTL